MRLFIIVFFVLSILTIPLYAQPVKEPIIVNGDNVEYSQDKKEVSAQGNVSVVYKDTKLTCDKIKVDLQNSEATAEGNVRLEDEKGILFAEKIIYNFVSKKGKIEKAKLDSSPYYGKGALAEKLDENHYLIKDGYITTCDLDSPHYTLSSKRVDFYPKDKVSIRQAKFSLRNIPLLYLPSYTHSLKDPSMHVRLIPGKSKDWGNYLLSSWRLNLTENTRSRIYLDYRSRLGLAEGFGLNYDTKNLGKGDYKYYYTQERTRKLPESSPAEFERYLVRWRHFWQINQRTNTILEYYKITDSKRINLGSQYNFLKDYFYREYEKESQPKSYILFNCAFNNSFLSLIVQKRVNSWYTHQYMVPDEKLPSISFSLPSFPLGFFNLYFKNQTEFSNLLNKDTSDQDDDVVRFDTYNELFLPMRLFIFNIKPSLGIRETYYSKDKEGNSLDPRTVFYSGLDLSTKFYRIFNLDSSFFDINGIKHIISPTVRYIYNHRPTIPKDKLQTFDEIDTIERNNYLNLELVNKFQTKRNKEVVDLAIFKITTDYGLARNDSRSKGFSDLLFDMELIPFAWLRVESDTLFDLKQDNFKIINFDVVNNFGKGRSFGLGHRYERKGGKELTSEFNWKFNPKWKFRIYERYQFAKIRGRGLKEQQYSITRDLHCWILDFIYNISKDHGHTFWFVFRLKAFPEVEFEFEQSYHGPKKSTQ